MDDPGSAHRRESHSTPVARWARLARDPAVWPFLAAVTLLVALYAFPILSREAMSEVGSYYFDLLLLPFVLPAIVGRARATSGRYETQFWGLLVVALAMWVAGLGLLVLSGDEEGLAWGLAGDLLYLGSYAAIMLALDRVPHIARPADASESERWLRSLGSLTFAVGWLAYFVVVPASVAPDHYATSDPSFQLYFALDIVLAVRLAYLVRVCRVSRWRRVYAALLVYAAATFVCDTTEWLMLSGRLPWEAGDPIDLLWAVPPAMLLLAALLGRAPATDPRPVRAVVDEAGSQAVRVGSALALGAFSFPVVDYGLYAAEWLDRASRGPRALVAMGNLVAMGAIAVAAYRTLAARQEAIRRQQASLEAELVRARSLEAVGRLAGALAHDFNNILTVVRGHCDLATLDLAPTHPARQSLDEVRRAADRAASVTSQLLAISQHTVSAPRHVDLNAVVLDMTGMLRRLISEEVVIVPEIGAEPVPVFVDPAEVGKILLGLGARARDVMPKGGRLVVGVRVFAPDDRWRLAHPGLGAREYAVLSVGDSGTGIEPGLRDRAFEPFLPLGAGVEGAGLVLAQVHGIARQNGGAVDLVSEPGGGTTFRIALPVDRTPGRVGPAAGVARQGRVTTALLVEPEASPRAVARSVLERHGCEVVEASNGADALTAAEARAWRIDLLVTAQELPGMSGSELARRLAARARGVRIVSMGAPGAGREADASVPEVVPVVALLKPFSQRALVEAVTTVLGAGLSDS